MTVLVTGGAGYIGSHTVLRLQEAGERFVVLDDLSTGSERLISPQTVFYRGDIRDHALVRAVVERHKVDAVIHFAARIDVAESVRDPLRYYRENLCASYALIETLVQCRVRAFIFSSTAAVYGNVGGYAIAEDQPCAPASPYGQSKLVVERILADVGSVSGMATIVLRYFNVAGADPLGRTGQLLKSPATHLIQSAIETALGKRDTLHVYGTDYDTPDGSAIRDFIHVTDLADAHLVALQSVRAVGRSGVFNVGYGRGVSVLEAIEAVQRETERNLPIVRSARRAGDVPIVVADSQKIRRELGWAPKYENLRTIVQHALLWNKKHADPR